MPHRRSPEMRRYWCVVPAAGAGRRFGSEVPKQYLMLAGRTVMQHTLDRLCSLPAIGRVVVACAADDERAQTLPYAQSAKLQFVSGGRERADSVLAGLKALSAEADAQDWVLVHDVARPCVRVADIEKLMQATAAHSVGGILANPVRDTMKRGNAEQGIVATVERAALWHALTPQLFPYGLLVTALESALAQALPVTDEASALELMGLSPLLVEGARDNIKITFPDDLRLAELFLAAQARESV